MYTALLRKSSLFYDVNENFAVMAGFDPVKGELASFIILNKLMFVGAPDVNGRDRGSLFTCQCPDGVERHKRLKQTEKHLAESFLSFYYREVDSTSQCVHTVVAEQIFNIPILPFNPMDDVEDGDEGNTNMSIICSQIIETRLARTNHGIVNL